MSQNVTVVYYPNSKDESGAFHVENVNTERLQAAFDKYDVHTIKYIIVERKSLSTSSFMTLQTESDIQSSLRLWKVNF